MVYAGIGRRVAAGLVDSQLMWPLMMAFYWLSVPFFYAANDYRFELIRLLLAQLCVGTLFAIVFLRLWGATPGMLMLGMRITSLAGEQVSLRALLVRYALPLMLAIVSAGTFIAAVFEQSQLDYINQDSYDLFLGIYSASSSFRLSFLLLQMLEVASFIYMFFNSRRQSLYDWLAGTVVIMRPAETALMPEAGGSPGLLVRFWFWLDAHSFASLMGRYLSLLPLVLFISFAAYFFPVLPVCLLLDIEFSNLGPIATAVWGLMFDIFVLTPCFVLLMLLKLVRTLQKQ